MLETSNDSIAFTFIGISQLFRFQRYGDLFVKVDERWAVKVNEGSTRQSGFLNFSANEPLKIYPVRVIELD